MKLAILLVVGGIAIVAVTGYLAYMDFADTVVGFFKSPQHYRISTKKGLPRKELRFHRRQYVLGDNSTEDERLAARTLKIFNSVRAVIASGRLDTLMGFIKNLGILKDNKIPLGPAANMMKLEWNRTMENMVKKATGGKLDVKNFDAINKFAKPIEIEGHISFYWMGGIQQTLEQLKNKVGVDLKAIDDILAHVETAETIIALIYLAIDFPGDVNITNKTLGPSNALVASRHQIGCSSNGFYSICIVQDDKATVLYETGVTCLNCVHSSCEWRVQPDGSYMEGDMCIYDPLKVPETNDTMVNETTTVAVVDSTTSLNSYAVLPIVLTKLLLLL